MNELSTELRYMVVRERHFGDLKVLQSREERRVRDGTEESEVVILLNPHI